MAWVVAAKPGGHCSAVLASIRIRVASVHESSSCQEKWDSKWKSVKLWILPSANPVLRGRFFDYSSSFPRIACKIRVKKGGGRRWSLPRNLKHHLLPGIFVDLKTNGEHLRRSSEARGRYDYYAKHQSYSGSQKAADSEDPTSGATGDDRGHGESENASFRRHFCSNTWRGFGVWSDCDYGANSRWQTPHQARTPQSINIGSPSDRSVLGLSPAGPVT